VTVDLSGVTYMDSSGLRALLEARDHLDGQARRLIVDACSRPVQRLFEITGVCETLYARSGGSLLDSQVPGQQLT